MVDFPGPTWQKKTYKNSLNPGKRTKIWKTVNLLNESIEWSLFQKTKDKSGCLFNFTFGFVHFSQIFIFIFCFFPIYPSIILKTIFKMRIPILNRRDQGGRFWKQRDVERLCLRAAQAQSG
jgi:hypothetical protein